MFDKERCQKKRQIHFTLSSITLFHSHFIDEVTNIWDYIGICILAIFYGVWHFRVTPYNTIIATQCYQVWSVCRLFTSVKWWRLIGFWWRMNSNDIILHNRSQWVSNVKREWKANRQANFRITVTINGHD